MNFPTGETFTYQAEDSETKVGVETVILCFLWKSIVEEFCGRISIGVTWIVYRKARSREMCLETVKYLYFFVFLPRMIIVSGGK